jgi:hypothetical protein
MDNEESNCWLANANPFETESYSDSDSNSRFIDMLLMLWAASLEKLAGLAKFSNISKEIRNTSEPLACSVAYYQAATRIHDNNPIAGFGSFRDSLKHLLKAATNWHQTESDDWPVFRSTIINELVDVAQDHFKQHGKSPLPDEVMEMAKKQTSTMVDYDTSNLWPYTEWETFSKNGMKPAHEIAVDDLESVPAMHTFGNIVRLPLAVGIIAKCKQYWFDELENFGGVEVATAKAEFIKLYCDELAPNIAKSIESEEWPLWAVKLLPIEPDF